MKKKNKTNRVLEKAHILVFLIVLLTLSSSTSSIYRLRAPVDPNPYRIWHNEKPSCLPPMRTVPERYRTFFLAACEENEIPLEILAAIAYVESRFSAYAVSPLRPDGNRDLGMFQFHSDFIGWLSDCYNKGIPFNPFSCEQSVNIAARHIKWLYERYGNWPDVVMAYNAGITRIDKGKIPDRTWEYLTVIYR